MGKKSFTKRDRISDHLKLAREHLDELERQEQDQHTTQRQKAAERRAALEQEQRLEEALAEIERLRAAKKDDKDKEPQASSSDPDAAFMWMADGGVAPAYNVQLVTDGAHGLIADVEVVNDPQDGQQIVPAMDRLKQRYGNYPPQALADGAYTNLESVMDLHERSIDYYSTWTGRNEAGGGGSKQRHKDYERDQFGFDGRHNEVICPQGQRLAYHHRSAKKGRETFVYQADAEDCRGCSARRKCCPKLHLKNGGRSVSFTLYDQPIEAFDEKMKKAESLAIYKKRAPLAEFPNAWIKTKLKLRRFATRGLKRVQCEAIWAAMTFNLQRMFRLAPA